MIDRKCHIHIATSRYADAGRALEGFAEEASEYSDLKGALLTLGRRCNIEGPPFQPSPLPLFEQTS